MLSRLAIFISYSFPGIFLLIVEENGTKEYSAATTTTGKIIAVLVHVY